ncbi:hypothetical protein OKW21_005526 [Catalinimonas alkaloidigena]|uniref:hypothetical protein n=1 Tax=Catalinimonas alkaloidigena TaxID=1075417 RepID=UPI0024076794|nr:hypothetical protein [Catalinimonas alkaloidigena]MDF9800263.1 hypothetical protein [Catalinimonas alkaloidigena]
MLEDIDLGSLIAKVLINHGLKNVFTLSENEKEDQLFEKVLLNTSKQLDRYYNSSVFGGNAYDFLKIPDVKNELKQILLPLSDLDTIILEDHIDFTSLPDDFIEKLRELLIHELLKEPLFRNKLIQVFQAYQLDNLQQDTEKIGITSSEGLKNFKKD